MFSEITKNVKFFVSGINSEAWFTSQLLAWFS